MDFLSLENALAKRCKNICWLLKIYLLASSPGIFISMYLTSYVFLSGKPSYWCDVPQLKSANWTNEQIKNISSPETDLERCTVYKWNYTHLASIGYEASIEYVKSNEKPDLMKCTAFIYDEIIPKQTIVSEWDLVCDKLPLRSTAQVAVAVGKFFGAFTFGLIGDRFGRKKIFILCSLIYIIIGPSIALVTNYTIFLVLRGLIGIACSGVYEAGYTILAEFTVKNYRAYLGCMYNFSYAIGTILLPLAAYFTANWRYLELAISLPTLLLLIHCWFLPESPRWLLTQGKLERACKVLGQDLECISPVVNDHNKKPRSQCLKKVTNFFNSFLGLFSTAELQKRILICYYAWFVAQLYYFALALNSTNLSANQYLYVGLDGLAEVPGYLLPLIMLRYLGRRTSSVALHSIAGLVLFLIFFIPKGWPIILVSMVGRMAISAIFAVINLQTCELFPTEYRNTAIGTSLTIGQLGSIAAPYLVDILGKRVAWYLPSTVCGSLVLVSGAFLLLLPETKDHPMVDTLQEMQAQFNHKP